MRRPSSLDLSSGTTCSVSQCDSGPFSVSVCVMGHGWTNADLITEHMGALDNMRGQKVKHVVMTAPPCAVRLQPQPKAPAVTTSR